MSDLRFYRRWYTQEFKPALDKALLEGKISKYTFDKLNKGLDKYEFEYKN